MWIMLPWYLTPKNIVNMNCNYKGMHWKCKEIEGTFYHVWWCYKTTSKFWKEIHEKIQKILKIKLFMKPEAMLLGVLPTNM